MQNEKQRIHKILENEVQRTKGIKFNLYTELECYKLADPHGSGKMHSFSTRAAILLLSHNIEEVVSEVINALLLKINEFQRVGSGWVIQKVNKINLDITTYNPIGM